MEQIITPEQAFETALNRLLQQCNSSIAGDSGGSCRVNSDQTKLVMCAVAKLRTAGWHNTRLAVDPTNPHYSRIVILK